MVGVPPEPIGVVMVRLDIRYVSVARLTTSRKVLVLLEVSTTGRANARLPELTLSPSYQLLIAPNIILKTFPFEDSVSTMSLDYRQHHASDPKRAKCVH